MPHKLTQGPLRGGYNGTFHDSREILFNDDKWHCVEAMFRPQQLNPAQDQPVANGELRGLGGWREPVIERTDVVFRSTDFPNMKFNQFFGAAVFPPRRAGMTRLL